MCLVLMLRFVTGVLVLGILGLFGADILGGVAKLQSTVIEQSRPQAVQTLKASSVDGNRGAMTKLTRREINAKLQQIPLFYATQDGLGVYVTNSRGILFAEKNDAERFAASQGKDLKVSATTMDKVYYPLIVKKQKLGKFIEGVAGASDPLADYQLQGSQSEIDQSPGNWAAIHEHDIPLFRVSGLAFSKPDGLEIPLFTRKEDALGAYSRLRESQATDLLASTRGGTAAASPTSQAPASAKAPDIQVTSLLDLVRLLSEGGFEGRALEVYPSIDAIEAARQLFRE